MAISRQDIATLLSMHSVDIKRMQRCLHKGKVLATNVDIACAWHTYSPDVGETTPKDQQSLAWADLPDSDIDLLQILRSHLEHEARGFWYYFIYLGSSIVAGLILAAVSHFFIFEEAIKRVSSQLTSPMVGANFYTAADAEGKKPGISVFAIDDDDLKYFRKTYPLSYAFHAQMLRELSVLSPKAIFIDVWFHDERDDPSIGALVAAICQLHRDGTRVYLATMSHQGLDTPGLRPELQAISASATGAHSLEGKPGACAVQVAVDKVVDTIDRQSWRYDLVSGAENEQIFSAAAQMYNDLPEREPLALSAAPLALIWGVEGAEINRRPPGYGPTESTGCRNEWYRIEAFPMPAAFRHRIFQSNPEIRKPFCTYHTTLPLSALRKMPGEALQPLIEDRLIVYGGNLQSLDDSLYSPVHGRLAGLHMHAMALDNLLHYGDQYPLAEEFDIHKPLSKGTIFPVAVVTIFALLATIFRAAYSSLRRNKKSFLYRRAQTTENPSQQHTHENVAWTWTKKSFIYLGFPTAAHWIGSWFIRIGLTIGMVLLMAWLGPSYFRLGPLSWMEYAVYPITIEFLHIGKKLADYMHPRLIDLSSLIKKIRLTSFT